MVNWLKVYRKLFLYSYKKYRDAHMDCFKNDIKCPNCNEWYSISGIKYKHEYVNPQSDWGTHSKCGQCGTDTYWNLEIAPVAIRCDSKGTPIQDK